MSASRRRPPDPPAPALTAVLREGLETVGFSDGIDVLDDWQWNASTGQWRLTCRLTVASADTTLIPRSTDWVVLVDPTYPWGAVHVYPNQQRGIPQTFPHQNANLPALADERSRTWRTGRLCLDTGVGTLGRHAADPEPFTAPERLAWRLQRARQWLVAASRGELVAPGQPFELPDFSTRPAPLVATSEDEESLSAWCQSTAVCGLAELVEIRATPSVLAVRKFIDLDGRPVRSPLWGAYISSDERRVEAAGWLRLPTVPVMAPWQAPLTWEDLRSTARAHGVDLDEILGRLIPRLRENDARILLVGFPIPAVVGGDATLMHWQPLELPELPPLQVTRRGFRPGVQPKSDPAVSAAFRDAQALRWTPAENWHPSTIAARGKLPPAMLDLRVMVIGAGALGSQIAEHLVRGGVREIDIVDDDRVQAGNLVRHTLGLLDVGRHKAPALAERLNLCGPHVNARGLVDRFPPVDRGSDLAAAARASELVIDCTGEDAVAFGMRDFPWGGERYFASCSLGALARTGFLYTAAGDSFPADDFLTRLRPILDAERTAIGPRDWPREGVGCWHPVFPARSDQVASLAASMVDRLADALENFVASQEPSDVPVLDVIEGNPSARRAETKAGATSTASSGEVER